MSHPILKIIFSSSILLALLANLFFFSTGIQPALAVSICYVNNNASGADDGASWDDAYTDLQSALMNDACTEIWVAQGLYKPTTGTDREVSFELKQGVALYGGFAGGETLLTQRNPVSHPTTLSGDIGLLGDISDNSYHVVYSHGVDNAVLDGFTITAGNADDIEHPYSIGGGMYNVESSPTITNVILSDNHAGWSGGGMYNINSNPILTNVNVDNNRAEWNGGGIYNIESSPIFTNVSFNHNRARWSGGGMANDNSSPELSGGAFNNNSAAINGGGMHNDHSSPILDAVIFSNNTVGFDDDDRLSGRNALTLSKAMLNGMDDAGGGMYNDHSSPTLGGVTFTNNSADYGGGAYNVNSNPTFTGVTFNGNSATISGGGLYNHDSHPTLSAPTFSNNLAGASGGGMYNDNSNPTLRTKVKFTGNSSDYGGGIYNLDSSPTFNDITLSNNHAEWDGGGMYNTNSSPTLTNAIFSKNSANGAGGGLYNDNSSPEFLVKVEFNENSANDGGGMYNTNSSPTLTNAIFSKNSANGAGGGLYNDNSSPEFLTKVEFNENSANGGGGIYNTSDSTPTLSAAVFSNNSATVNGGGVYNEHSSPTLTNSVFNKNSAGNAGGGMYNDNSTPTFLPKVVFNENTALNGGGMYNVNGSNPALLEATFSGNFASASGGGLYNDNSSPALTNATFEDNHANNAGGGLRNTSGSAPALEKVTFNNNSTNDIGGGIANDNSNPILEEVTFHGNSAIFGGGMHNDNSSPELSRVTFSNNSATGHGSGGGMFNSNSHPTLTNITLNGNSAVAHGGGIYNIRSNPTLTNVTFSGNSAQYGGGLFIIYSSKPVLKNVILADNPGDNCSFDEADALDAASAHNLINDNSCRLNNGSNGNKIGAGFAINLGTLQNNGGFTQTMTLLPKSVAINAGLDSACPAIDQRGLARPRGLMCDIGAVEFEEYVATFDANGGTGTMSPQIANLPTALAPNAFARVDYVFTGWNTEAGGSGTAYNDGATYAFDVDVTLYAQWTIASFDLVNKWTAAFDLSHGWTVQDYVRTLGDVNGDGLDDAVGFGLDGVYVALSTGSSFGAATKWTSAFDLSHGWTVAQYVRTVGDVNGDGRADLVGFGLDGIYVALSTGSGFGAVSKWTSAFDLSHGWTVAQYVRTVGDVNGDGRADLVGFGLDGVYVALSTGSSFGPATKRASAFDLSHGWTVAQYVRTVGDVNGDGRADLVGFGLDGVYVALSTGTGFGAVSKWTSAFDLSHGWTVSQYVRTVDDMDGDGQADLIGFGQDGVYVALSTGSSFGAATKWTSAFDLSHGWTVQDYVRTVGDVNGDGRADLVGFGLDGVYVATAK